MSGERWISGDQLPARESVEDQLLANPIGIDVDGDGELQLPEPANPNAGFIWAMYANGWNK